MLLMWWISLSLSLCLSVCLSVNRLSCQNLRSYGNVEWSRRVRWSHGWGVWLPAEGSGWEPPCSQSTYRASLRGCPSSCSYLYVGLNGLLNGLKIIFRQQWLSWLIDSCVYSNFDIFLPFFFIVSIDLQPPAACALPYSPVQAPCHHCSK